MQRESERNAKREIACQILSTCLYLLTLNVEREKCKERERQRDREKNAKRVDAYMLT